MRNIVLLFAFIFFQQGFSQEIKEIAIKTEVKEVTVFVENAQISRNKTVQVGPGTSVLKFIDLSPFIIANSVQAKIDGDITILSVNHQQEFIDKLVKPDNLIKLEQELETVNERIDMLDAELEVMNEEIAFLNSNRNIGGDGAINLASLKEATDYYRKRLSEIKVSILKNRKSYSELQTEATDLSSQITAVAGVKEFANGSISIKIKSNSAANLNVELSYVVKNASWLPFYDIKAKNINNPVELVYKAKVKQDTKIDWKNVKIRFSTADPNISGIKPELKTYYLNYNTPPPVYSNNPNQVSGVVLDESGVPLPGANVVVEGTTIGTTTDFDGRYNLSIPNQQGNLVFTYIGYVTMIKPIVSSVINITMEEDSAALEEVVVLGYGSKKNRNRAVDDMEIAAPKPVSTAVPVDQIQRQTTVEFEIDIPYSLPSDNISYTVDMAKYELPADYKYISVPKVEPSAFLIANIVDWEKYNLLEGEANLIFENTFVGKTILDVRSATDTLQLSLGRDKNIIVKRNKISDYSSKKFIGSRKEEIREWNISLKNNKKEKVNLEIHDQVPKSTLDDITVEVIERSRGNINAESGEVRWNITLEPNESQDLKLGYSVKYPKNKRLFIE